MFNMTMAQLDKELNEYASDEEKYQLGMVWKYSVYEQNDSGEFVEEDTKPFYDDHNSKNFGPLSHSEYNSKDYGWFVQTIQNSLRENCYLFVCHDGDNDHRAAYVRQFLYRTKFSGQIKGHTYSYNYDWSNGLVIPDKHQSFGSKSDYQLYIVKNPDYKA